MAGQGCSFPSACAATGKRRKERERGRLPIIYRPSHGCILFYECIPFASTCFLIVDFLHTRDFAFGCFVFQQRQFVFMHTTSAFPPGHPQTAFWHLLLIPKQLCCICLRTSFRGFDTSGRRLVNREWVLSPQNYRARPLIFSSRTQLLSGKAKGSLKSFSVSGSFPSREESRIPRIARPMESVVWRSAALVNNCRHFLGFESFTTEQDLSPPCRSHQLLTRRPGERWRFSS